MLLVKIQVSFSHDRNNRNTKVLFVSSTPPYCNTNQVQTTTYLLSNYFSHNYPIVTIRSQST